MSNDKDAEKVASKGISRLHNKFLYEQYKDALYKDEVFEATNFTMRVRDNQMRTMLCKKRALSGMHVKNCVQDDRVSIIPHKRHKIDP